MSFLAALDNLIVLQASVSITDPLSLSIKKAFAFVPPQSVILPDLPAWVNAWDLVREERHVGLRVLFYTVSMQLFVAEASLEQDRMARAASAFMEALVNKLDTDVTLGGQVAEASLRGASPTLAILERAGKGYIGLNLLLDLEIKEAKDFT